MSIESKFNDEQILITRIRGRMERDDVTGHAASLLRMAQEENGAERDFYEMICYDFGSFLELDQDDIDVVCERRLEAMRAWKRGGVAFVAPGDLNFGICQQISARLSGRCAVDLQTFRSEEEAMAWLKWIAGGALHFT